MRFTPILFAGAAAAAVYGSDPSYGAGYGDESYGYTSSSTTSVKASPTWADPGYGAGYGAGWGKSSSTSTSSSTKKGWKTTTKYETECWTETSSSVTKTWTSVKAIPTVCEDDDEEWGNGWGSAKPSSTPAQATGTWAKPSTPAAPVKPATWSSAPYCSAYTETCTVTVTATGSPSGTWGGAVPTGKPTTPVAAVYPVPSASGSWPAGAAQPSGGAWTSPYAAQFTGAASAQKAGALLAGAGAVAALLL